jgi:hypothetical protein
VIIPSRLWIKIQEDLKELANENVSKVGGGTD